PETPEPVAEPSPGPEPEPPATLADQTSETSGAAEPDAIGPVPAEAAPGEPEPGPPQAGEEPTEVLADHGISADAEPRIISVVPSPPTAD
ncbi:MAG: hypothetical protein M3N98_06425, partial [Actinomycetota bacterium]|nr:hypothetical protein [Actinomycetota bacterium]